MPHPLVVILFTTLLFIPSVPSCAQDAVPARAGVHVWYGGAVGQGSVLGKIEEGRIQMLGVRYHRLLLPSPTQDRSSYEAPTLTYTADLIPVTQLSIPEEGAPGAFFSGGSNVGTSLTTYGIGGYPLGLRLQFQREGRIQPFFAGHTGLLYFFDHVPDERGQRLHFAAALGGGLYIPLPRHTSLTLGYRYHHLSNGFRGSINPGLDVNMLYLGVGTTL